MTTSSSALPLTTEETDQVRRSVKKHKRIDDDGPPSDGPEIMDEGHPPSSAWQNLSFVEVVAGQPLAKTLYTGDGEEDLLDDLGLTDILQHQETVLDGEFCPVADLSWEHYKQSWQPWRRALVVKTLGKTFSFKVLEPRIRKAWQLIDWCELINIDRGYIVARFYSQLDYLKVLQDGPWMVLGHYLTITKWTPNFKPMVTDVHSTLV